MQPITTTPVPVDPAVRLHQLRTERAEVYLQVQSLADRYNVQGGIDRKWWVYEDGSDITARHLLERSSRALEEWAKENERFPGARDALLGARALVEQYWRARHAAEDLEQELTR